MSSKKQELIKASIQNDVVITENSDLARELFNTYTYGSVIKKKYVQLSLHEALYLIEKGRLLILDGKNKVYDEDRFLKYAKRKDKSFRVKYAVFKDFRERGYVIKTALKFGAEFRVYDRGIKPGEDHAKWVVFPVAESTTTTWYEFAAKNRVAHSTKKRLLLGIVDEENDVTYYEIRWVRP